MLLWVVRGLFALLGLITFIAYLGRRGRAARHVAAMFATVALAAVLQPVATALGAQDSLSGAIFILLMLLHPFMILRLASYYRPISRAARGWVLAAYFVAIVLSVLAGDRVHWLPVAYMVVYFVVIEAIAGAAFVRGARATSGVTRYRLWLASAGSVCIGLTIATAVLLVFPSLKVVTAIGVYGFITISVVSYYVAFVTPRWLRTLWQRREIARFYREMTSLAPGAVLATVEDLLRNATARAVSNCSAVGIGLRADAAASDFTMRFLPTGDSETSEFTCGITAGAVPELAFSWNRERHGRESSETLSAVESAADWEGAEMALVVPISYRRRPIGLLAALLDNSSLFYRDDLEALSFIVRYCAMTMEVRGLLNAEASLAERLEIARAGAVEASRSKSEFLANMSHELRTPLNSIIGFSEVLMAEAFGELNERQKRYVANVQGSGRQLLQLINDVLDLSKIEAGRMAIRYGETTFAESAREVLETVRPLALTKDVRLEVLDETSEATLSVDPPKFRQILYNLVTNAVGRTLPHGTVAVRAAVDAHASRDAGDGTMPAGGAGEPVAEVLRVEVVDDGVGMSAADRERVFGTFERFDAPAASNDGTGLGLALTKRLVEMHGGSIGVTGSGEDKGTTFMFTLPVNPTAVQGETERPSAAAGEGAADGPLVLVIEDDARARELITIHLERLGCRWVCAIDEARALEIAERRRPDAITLDIYLPTADGWNILRRLKASPSTREIPVIVISISQDRERGVALGADWFFQKPISEGDLTATFTSVLANRRHRVR